MWPAARPGRILRSLWVKTAVDLALRGQVQAVVTAPVNKDKWLAQRPAFSRPYRFFRHPRPGAPPAMFFWSPGLKVALFTHHLPLRDVFARLERGQDHGFRPPGRQRNCGGCSARNSPICSAA